MDMELLRKALTGARICYDPKIPAELCKDMCPYCEKEEDKVDCGVRLQADMVAVLEEIAAESREEDPQEKTEGKPPLGVKPYFIAIPERIRELAEAICRNPETEKVGQWALEIGMHASTLSSMQEE